MTKMPHQTIKTPNGEELVVLPRAEFDRLAAMAAEAEEDLADLSVAWRRRDGGVECPRWS